MSRVWLRRAIPVVVLLLLAAAALVAYRRVRAAPAASLAAARAEVAAGQPPTPDAVPAPGAYRYRQTGSERLSLGPLRIVRTLPATALLSVRAGERGRVEYHWRYASDVGERIAVAPYKGSGQRLVERGFEARLPFAEFTLGGSATPALWRPPSPRPGPLQVVTYQLDGVVFRRTARVVRREAIDVGGQSVPVWRIDANEDLTGTTSGDVVEHVWWSPELGLDVRRSIDVFLTGRINHRITTTVELQSVLPAR